MRLTAFLSALLFAAPVWGQQAKTILVDAPNVPGGKVAIAADRDQLRAGPGTKTARLPHELRAALNKADARPTTPATWDWTTKDGKRLSLPMLGNDRYGDCYPVTTVKLAMMWVWMTQGVQLNPDTTAVVNWYLAMAGGDNGTTDSQVFPEFKKGVPPPDRKYKPLDLLIVPATDTTTLKFVNWAFGPTMFTFTVYQNFMNVKPGQVMTGNSGRVIGGHAVPFSGRGTNGWAGETWGFTSPFWATDQWVRGVDPEFVAAFSLDWFDARGFAPNGLHYTVLAPLWESIGGAKLPASPFPAPGPTPGPPPPVDPKFTGDVAIVVTFKDGAPVAVKLGTAPAPAKLTRAQVEQLARDHAKAAGIDWKPIIDALIQILLEYFASQNMLADAPGGVIYGTTPAGKAVAIDRATWDRLPALKP